MCEKMQVGIKMIYTNNVIKNGEVIEEKSGGQVYR